MALSVDFWATWDLRTLWIEFQRTFKVYYYVIDQPSQQVFYSRSLNYRRFPTRYFTSCTRPIFIECWRNLKEKLSSIAPCKEIRNPGNFCLRNPYPEYGKICLWNPESQALESGIQPGESGIPLKIAIQNPSSTDKEWDPESTIQNGVGYTYMGRPVTTLNNEGTSRIISSKFVGGKRVDSAF